MSLQGIYTQDDWTISESVKQQLCYAGNSSIKESLGWNPEFWTLKAIMGGLLISKIEDSDEKIKITLKNKTKTKFY